MPRAIACFVLSLFLGAPLLPAQQVTHLGVPSKQMIVLIRTTPAAGQFQWTSVVEGVAKTLGVNSYFYPDGTPRPSLVITDLEFNVEGFQAGKFYSISPFMLTLNAGGFQTTPNLLTLSFLGSGFGNHVLWRVPLTSGIRVPPTSTLDFSASLPSEIKIDQIILHGYLVND